MGRSQLLYSKAYRLFGKVRAYFTVDKSRQIYSSPATIALCIIVLIYIRNCTNDSTNDGNVFFEQKEYEKAIELYDEYLTLHPRHVTTWYNRGRCYEAMENYAFAIHDYEKALDIDPHHIKSILSLAQCYYKEEKYNMAAGLCDQAVSLDKQSYLANYYKGRAYHKQGDFFHAFEGYKEAIRLKPDFGFAYFQRASLFLSVRLRSFGCEDLKIADSLHVAGAHEALLEYCR